MATTKGELARVALRAMEEAGIGFAVIHGVDRLSSDDISDVDLVVACTPAQVMRKTDSLWRSDGLVPVLFWPYDIGGTATIFLSTLDAREGVQLDMLYDIHGLGKYGIRSDDLLARSSIDDDLAASSDPDRLVYLWKKRSLKREVERLADLRKKARSLDSDEVYEASSRLTGSRSTAEELLNVGIGLRPSFSLRGSVERLWRMIRRAISHVGFWAHVENQETARILANRMARFLVTVWTGPVPSALWQPIWFVSTVLPVRIRPGLCITTGKPPRVIRPDLIVGELPLETAATTLVEAMRARTLSK